MERRHLWLRSRRQVAIARVRHEVVQAIRDFFHQRDFVLVDTPILSGSIGESAGTLFETEYFDLGKAYLAQTGQLYLEAACAALGRVYCFGPTFRAEKSKTRRHLTEFWMVEPEVAFNDSEANMRLQEEFVSYIVGRVLDRRKEELRLADRTEDRHDRREDIRDRREDVRDKREDIRDRREDIWDAKHDGGRLDRLEDIADRREDLRDRREDVGDRREDRWDRREDRRDEGLHRGETQGVRDHGRQVSSQREGSDRN
jgi:hypothetical protein